MKTHFLQIAVTGTLAALLALIPERAAANDGMYPYVFELIQEDADVRVSLRISDMGEPGLDATYRVARAGSGEIINVVDEISFAPEDATVDPGPSCRWWEPASQYCLQYPEYCADCDADGSDECFGTCAENATSGALECVEDLCGGISCSADCDGDGVGDCDGWCETIYTFEVIDYCVSPGEYEYALLFWNTADEEWRGYSSENSSIDVTPVEEECTPPSSDDDESTDCSVASVGHPQAGSLLRLLLGLYAD